MTSFIKNKIKRLKSPYHGTSERSDMQLHTARARESIVRSENKEQGPLAEKRASGWGGERKMSDNNISLIL